MEDAEVITKQKPERTFGAATSLYIWKWIQFPKSFEIVYI